MQPIILLDRIEVELPLTDCKPARRQGLGAFSSFEQADAWLLAQAPDQWPRDLAISRRQFGFFEATEYVVDDPEFDGRRRVLGPDGSVRGEVPDWDDKRPPWPGEASECRFKSGDIVGFVHWNEFRWGIVYAGKWQPADGGSWTVDMVTDWHWHPHGCELFRIPQPVPRATRNALRIILREAKIEAIRAGMAEVWND